MSTISFYKTQKINKYLAIELESHTTLDHIGCIGIEIYINKDEYYKKPDKLATIGEMLEDIRYAINDLCDLGYNDRYYIDEDILDVVKTDLLQQTLIKLLKNEVKDMEEFEECQ